VVDPFVQQAELTASDGAAGDQFGFSIALSGDGNTAVVGRLGTQSMGTYIKERRMCSRTRVETGANRRS